ncbi:hypothetical protein [Demequina capsici]|uniref:DUF4328 domain-containing protein n=1 Tax=Demequina capsici TaxID=3075620 RepID=A0AA96F539_9MICO|nr:hypothetical protein [Demequina sp. OYTSA14]WNM24216.1 hypothetical protein RN606_12745 [Demequina sp. OYTSA14]
MAGPSMAEAVWTQEDTMADPDEAPQHDETNDATSAGAQSPAAAPLAVAARQARTWTGVYTAVVAASAAVLVAYLFGVVPLTPDTLLTIYAAIGVGAVMGWMRLAAWMGQVRTALAARGAQVPPPWQIWLSWLIPVYAWFGPFQAMRLLTAGVEGIAPVRSRWWGSFIIAGFLWFQVYLLGGAALAMIGFAGSAVSLFFSSRALRELIARTTESVAGPA